MRIVILEAGSLGEDMVFDPFEELGEVVRYSVTTREQMPERVRDAEVIVANKLPICEETIGEAKSLRLVCLTATGINNLDGDYLISRGIAAYNVAGYSTNGVAQHTFALLFYVLEKLNYYDRYVKSGEYSRGGCFSHFSQSFFELQGKTWGILGLGAIGRRVAELASAFGCRVICCSASGRTYQSPYEQVELDTLLGESDVLSIHAPLNDHTEGLMDKEAFRKMKPSAILINVARGAIIREEDLYEALTAGEIAGAGLDVLAREPMAPDNPLLRIQDSGRLIITPHIGWAAKETRFRVVDEVIKNIRRFQSGDSTNRVY
ncbi:MAG: NAD(P)-dependent oxidoreductase [Eubacteriales bacterium]|nr:NAD(P)-dependent oxidoreductase [Eubacteriales bacterium]